ncbi:hypothetical protein JCM19235_6966 [Vibrio maritimus]|uniref:HTH lysR-type domain-containing protein n=1 Tax=Vibrio maritimus TaxID=990268 RepID=A0A090RV40_9VIBR|nr:hypothetical protein JCM19235_6966 [Vibrio maritimus]
MLSLEQLTVFKAAAELGSFSAAARDTGKAVSTVSNSISNLEVHLGSHYSIALLEYRH